MDVISVQTLKERLDNGENIHLLDVREADERAVYNIGGTFIPLGNVLTMQTDEIAEWQNEEIVCYCRSGRRSMQAGLMLESLGFTNVKNLEGGMLDWQEKFPG